MTLRREVEAPRSGTGLWLPLMALASAAMLTIVSGIAVMTRAPRAVVVEPVETPAAVETRRQRIEREIIEAKARMEQQRVLCRAPVHRGNLDGQAQPYDECIAPQGVLPAAAAAKGEAR